MDISNVTVNLPLVIAGGFAFFTALTGAVWFISNKLVKKHVCTYKLPEGLVEQVKENKDNIDNMNKEINKIKIDNASMKADIKSIKETTDRIDKTLSSLVKTLLTGTIVNIQKN